MSGEGDDNIDASRTACAESLLNFDYETVKPSCPFSVNSDPSLLLLRCAHFAAVKHTTERRKDPQRTPYINHPLGVAHILAEEGGVTDIKVLMAAMLHDTVEDTDTSFEEIEEFFGADVRKIVSEVTDDIRLPAVERKQKQILNARKASYEAKLVKLADKLYNLRDINRVYPVGWTEDRVQAYFDWSYEVYCGLKGTNAALEQKLEEVFAARRQLSNDEKPREWSERLEISLKCKDSQPVLLIICVAASRGGASSPVKHHSEQDGLSAELHVADEKPRIVLEDAKPVIDHHGADKDLTRGRSSDNGLHGGHHRRTNRQGGNSASFGESVMAIIGNLMRDNGLGGGTGVNADVEFSSEFGRTMNSVLIIMRNQANALLHLLRALAPLDRVLADNNWRSAQTAMMRQGTASTFNIIMDILLQIVRGLTRLIGGSTEGVLAAIGVIFVTANGIVEANRVKYLNDYDYRWPDTMTKNSATASTVFTFFCALSCLIDGGITAWKSTRNG
ncbi:unnamed protein product [Notodromas monacha]|uniref:Guanosine-3',5'-bis(diphosphate) 3'-pyrophosphohydrolase MESH1 n=1 Tax=Notodromas monacha TaxID=399045 RepID=A0A7R9BGP9_9CRUS|nr:unnamed protein product [Notodromas monacha]CAG0914070.1 unnamed protein product [Notodromas monacha]